MRSTNPMDALAGRDTANPPSKPSNHMSKDDFIKMFTAQLKMQDPMKPLDNSVMLQQMSSLTQLSATEELEGTINNLNANMSTSQVISSAQIIGKRVQVISPKTPLEEKGMNGSVIVLKPATAVDVTIKDPTTDKVLKVLHLGAANSKGSVDFTWDGKDEAGKQMDQGLYKVEAFATIGGKPIQMPTCGSFKVDSVTHDTVSGAVMLNLDQMGGVKMDDVIKIQ